MKKALVTGHEGFVGRHLLPVLMQAGYEVVGTEQFDHFILDYHSKEKYDVVVHLGANIVNVSDRMKLGMGGYKDIILDYKVCRWVEQNPPKEMFVAMSSCAVDYPQDPYCVVKRMLEEFAHNLYQKSDVPVTILRPFSGYGYDQSEQYPFRSIMDRALAFQDPLQVWGGSQMRDWLHVDDLISGIMFAVDGKFPQDTPIQLGTGVAVDFYTFAKCMAKTVARITRKKYNPEIVSVNKAESSPKREASPCIANQHGWHPDTTLADGMRQEVIKAITERKLVY